MAVTDVRRNAKFDQKRDVCVGVFDVDFSDLTGDGSLVATLAAETLITRVTVLEKTAANAGATVDILAGTDLIVDEGAVDANGVLTVALTDLTVAKDLVIKAGATAPTQGTFKFIVEYVEYNMTNGQYTRS